MGHKRMPGLRFVDGIWHIRKRVRGYGQLCESTQSREYEEAEKYLIRRLDQIRLQLVYGERPARFFAEAATKFIEDDVTSGAADNALWLKQAMPFIGGLHLHNVHDETLKPFIAWCRTPKKDSLGRQRGANKGNTIGNKLSVVRQVLTLAASRWRDPVTGMTWLSEVPEITDPGDDDKRDPYPLSWKEQALLFPELPAHQQVMALFDVNTGLRSSELCGLRWSWEREVEEMETTMFVIPRSVAKNRQERIVPLNAVARSIIDAQRGRHPEFVFVYQPPGKREPHPVSRMSNHAWRKAVARAASKYRQTLGRDAPEGFATLHPHDLRHTFGRRLRAAEVSQETRADLLGHKTGNITTHYSMGELQELVRAVEKVERQKLASPEMTTGYLKVASR
jgi:integrase